MDSETILKLELTRAQEARGGEKDARELNRRLIMDSGQESGGWNFKINIAAYLHIREVNRFFESV